MVACRGTWRIKELRALSRAATNILGSGIRCHVLSVYYFGRLPRVRRKHAPCGGALSMEIGRAQSELQSLMRISYAVFCLKKTKTPHPTPPHPPPPHTPTPPPPPHHTPP